MAYNPFAMQLLPIDFSSLNTSQARYTKDLAAEVSIGPNYNGHAGRHSSQLLEVLERYALADLSADKAVTYVRTNGVNNSSVNIPRQKSESESIADLVSVIPLNRLQQLKAADENTNYAPQNLGNYL